MTYQRHPHPNTRRKVRTVRVVGDWAPRRGIYVERWTVRQATEDDGPEGEPLCEVTYRELPELEYDPGVLTGVGMLSGALLGWWLGHWAVVFCMAMLLYYLARRMRG